MRGEDAERAALRAVAHLLPDKWKQIIEVVTAAVPPTPEQRIPALMKTIFTRFCQVDGQIPEMTARAGAANHLGHLLRDDAPRADVPDHSAATQSMTAWRAAFIDARFTNPTAAVMAPHELTDFQNGFYEMARLLRHAGLPGGHP